MTRDSFFLKFGQGAALLGGILALATSPADYGLTEVQFRWILAACTILGTLTGHLGTSPLRGENDQKRVNRSGSLMWFLPILLVGGLTVGCAGKAAPPSVQPVPPSAAPSSSDINRAAVQIANTGTHVLAAVEQVVILVHQVVPPSQLRLDINEAVSAFGRTARAGALRARDVLTMESLSAFAGDLARGVDALLSLLSRLSNDRISALASVIRERSVPIKAALSGGVQ